MAKKPEVEVENEMAILDGRTIPLPNIAIERAIDAGAHGAVFQGIDLNLNRKIAVKVWYKSGDEVREGAIREAQRLANVEHPLFVKVHHLGLSQTHPYAAMELIDGQSLKKWLSDQPNKKPNLEQLYQHLTDNQESIRQRCAFWFYYSRGLSHVYSLNILHGDPHTGNLLIVNDKSGLLSSYLNDHVLKHGSYSALKIIDLGTSFLWDDPSKRVIRESRIILDTARKLFPDFPPKTIMSMDPVYEPQFLLKILDKFVEFILELASIPGMTKTDFDYFSHNLPQLLGWHPFFNYGEISKQLLSIFKPEEALDLIKETRWHLEDYRSNRREKPSSEDASLANLHFASDVEALLHQSSLLRKNFCWQSLDDWRNA